jgi:uncharacterized protein YdhG (YjbR/CyaY superfamily)
MSVVQGVSISVEGGNMRTDQPVPKNIDEYVAGFPPDVQDILERVRTTIKKASPEAEEAISYQMPTFRLDGNLVHFAAFKNHIGLYPTPSGTERFREELSSYETGKGSIQFPLDKPIPYELIARIVKFRVKENRERAAARRKRK